MQIDCRGFEAETWESWLSETTGRRMMNPFATTGALASWIDRTPEAATRIIRVRSPETSWIAAICRCGGVWRGVGHDLFDYFPMVTTGDPIAWVRSLSEVVNLDGIGPARFDRVLFAIPPARAPYGCHMRLSRARVYVWENGAPGGLSDRDSLRRRLRGRMDRVPGVYVERVARSEHAALLSQWRHLKHDWVLRKRKHYFLSKKRKFSILGALINAPDVPSEAWTLRTKEGSIAAVLFGFMDGHRLGYYLTAYDDQFARYSPSLLLLLEIVALEQIEMVDFMWGEESYKARFSNASRSIVSIHSLHGGVR